MNGVVDLQAVPHTAELLVVDWRWWRELGDNDSLLGMGPLVDLP